MFRFFQLTTELKEKCREISKNKPSDMNYHDNVWYEGFLGEAVMRLLYNQGLESMGNGPDGGVDMILDGRTIDVKTQGYKGGHPTLEWGLNFAAHQMYHQTEYLFFCMYNREFSIIEPVGWISMKDFRAVAQLYPDGTVNPLNSLHTFQGDTYVIQIKDLQPFNENNYNLPAMGYDF